MSYDNRNISIDDFYALVTIDCTERGCEAKQHRIGVRANSTLVFFDHDQTMPQIELLSLKAELGPAHDCARQFRAWNQGSTSELATVLADCYIRLAESKKRQRRRNRCGTHREFNSTCAHCTGDELHRSVKDRWARRTSEVARECLRMSTYRTGDDNEGSHEWSLRITYGQPTIEGTMERSWDAAAGESGKSVPNTAINAKVRHSWIKKVHAEGLAHVGGGLFVLDVLQKRPDGKFVLLVGKQGRGYGVTPQSAIYDPKKDKLHWY